MSDNQQARELHEERREAVTQLYMKNQESLQDIEDRLRSKLVSEAPLLSEISHYLLSLGGKRIRPLLALTAGRLFGMQTPSSEMLDGAVGLELIHMATLLHDDIIDRSPTRRHKVSAYQLHGLTATLLAGDFLLSRAFGVCANLDRFVIEKTERACIALTEGEIAEGKLNAKDVRTLGDYIHIVEKKTGALFSLATCLGVHLAGGDPRAVKVMEDFGMYCGIAFQMADDILDITADENVLGKLPGTDLRQKTPSLVNILWLETREKKALDFFGKEEHSEAEIADCVNYLKNSAIIGLAHALATEYSEKAKEQLLSLDGPKLDHGVRSELINLVGYTVDRGC